MFPKKPKIKKEYIKPTLTVHDTVTKLTKEISTGGADDLMGKDH